MTAILLTITSLTITTWVVRQFSERVRPQSIGQILDNVCPIDDPWWLLLFFCLLGLLPTAFRRAFNAILLILALVFMATLHGFAVISADFSSSLWEAAFCILMYFGSLPLFVSAVFGLSILAKIAGRTVFEMAVTAAR